jgi:hypothetical protein
MWRPKENADSHRKHFEICLTFWTGQQVTVHSTGLLLDDFAVFSRAGYEHVRSPTILFEKLHLWRQKYENV